jgi:hypothetical protein
MNKNYIYLLLLSYASAVMLRANGLKFKDESLDGLLLIEAMNTMESILATPLFFGVALLVGVIAKWLKFRFWYSAFGTLGLFILFTYWIMK